MFFSERSVEMVMGLMATLEAGGAYLPLDPSHPPDRLSFTRSDAQPKILLAQRTAAGKLPPCTEEVVFLEEDFVEESDANPTNNTQPENLAYVIYTSGSTGRPKGVLNTHRGICNWLLWLQETYALSRLKVPELRTSLKAKLPSYILPSAIVVLKKFPVNLNGKVDRQALPAPSLVRGRRKISGSAQYSGSSPSGDLGKRFGNGAHRCQR
jgi:acyl-CoA synthetase (AMP-forming)/AMP-acid ligase II